MNEVLRTAYLAERAKHFGDGSHPRDALTWARDDTRRPQFDWYEPDWSELEELPGEYGSVLQRARVTLDDHREIVLDVYDDPDPDLSWLGSYVDFHNSATISRARGRYFLPYRDIEETAAEWRKMGYARGDAYAMARAAAYRDLDLYEEWARGEATVVGVSARLLVDGEECKELAVWGSWIADLCDPYLNEVAQEQFDAVDPR